LTKEQKIISFVRGKTKTGAIAQPALAADRLGEAPD